MGHFGGIELRIAQIFQFNARRLAQQWTHHEIFEGMGAGDLVGAGVNLGCYHMTTFDAGNRNYIYLHLLLPSKFNAINIVPLIL